MRRATNLLAFLALLLPGPRLAAQNNGAMPPVVPSPTATSLGKFGDIPISHYTGIPEIRVPLLTAKGKTLELPIALMYHASGIKVEEIGGWVGAGWALEAGGVITRTVRGIVDEKPEGYFNTGHALYDPANWTEPPPDELLLNIHHETIDGEPDQFFFNFAGHSGEIVAGPLTSNEADPIVYATIPYRKWRIEPQFGSEPYYSAYGILSWVITTEDGTRYTFDALEVHHDRTTQWQGSGGRDYHPYTSSWYLTEIHSPGGDSITLEYEPYTAEHHMGMYREEINEKGESPEGVCATPGYEVGSSTIYDLHSQSVIRAQRLASITTAAHSVTFTADSLREDARSPNYGTLVTGRQKQEPRLNWITVMTPDGGVLRRFVFEYNYSLGGRLTLKNVYEVGSNGDSLPPYSFTYYGPTLPARVTDRTDYHDPDPTASFALDHWGYYNGKTSNTTPIPPGVSPLGNDYAGSDRTPDFEFTKAGALKTITYPTGGFNEFIYEPNWYSTIGDGSPLVDDTPQNHNTTATSNPGDDVETTTDFTVGGVDATVDATVDVYVSEPCGPSPCPVAELWRGGDIIGRWSSSDTAEPIVGGLSRDTTYTLKAWNQGRAVTVAITVHWQERVAVPNKAGAGVRIAEVRADDGMGNVTIRKFSYLEPDLVHSTGVIGSEPRYDYTHDVTLLGSHCHYFSRSSTSRIPLGSGPIVGYSTVTESRGAGGEFGSTRRTFFAGGDYPQHDRWPYLRYTSNAWRRGHQGSAAEYDASGAIQRYDLSMYTFPTWEQTTKTFRGLAVDVYSASIYNGMAYLVQWNRFHVESALKLLDMESTTVYAETGQDSFFTTRHFEYGNPDHAQLTEIRETNSDGAKRITRMRYPADYATGSGDAVAAALTAMQGGAHMHSHVIERWVTEKVGSTETVLEAVLTTFKEFPTARYLPYQRFVLNIQGTLP